MVLSCGKCFFPLNGCPFFPRSPGEIEFHYCTTTTKELEFIFSLLSSTPGRYLLIDILGLHPEPGVRPRMGIFFLADICWASAGFWVRWEGRGRWEMGNVPPISAPLSLLMSPQSSEGHSLDSPVLGIFPSSTNLGFCDSKKLFLQIRNNPLHPLWVFFFCPHPVVVQAPRV